MNRIGKKLINEYGSRVAPRRSTYRTRKVTVVDMSIRSASLIDELDDTASWLGSIGDESIPTLSLDDVLKDVSNRFDIFSNNFL